MNVIRIHCIRARTRFHDEMEKISRSVHILSNPTHPGLLVKSSFTKKKKVFTRSRFFFSSPGCKRGGTNRDLFFQRRFEIGNLITAIRFDFITIFSFFFTFNCLYLCSTYLPEQEFQIHRVYSPSAFSNRRAAMHARRERFSVCR